MLTPDARVADTVLALRTQQELPRLVVRVQSRVQFQDDKRTTGKQPGNLQATQMALPNPCTVRAQCECKSLVCWEGSHRRRPVLLQTVLNCC